MTDSLAQAFRAGSPRRTTWRGHTVQSFVTLPVTDGQRIQLTRVAASPVRAQALKLAVDRGDLRANGVLAKTIAVWSHSAPETCVLEVVGRKAKSVDIWNAWSLAGVDSSWLGQAAMIVNGQGPDYTLRCSDGLGSASFGDLVVRVEVLSRA